LIGIAYAIEIPLLMGAIWFDYRLIFVVILVAAILSFFAVWILRCPCCDKLVTNRVVRLLGMTIQVPTGFPERMCSKCGCDLVQPSVRASADPQTQK